MPIPEETDEVCELKNLEAIYLRMVEGSPDAKIVVNQAGRVLVFNHRAELMFGWGRSEVIGKPLETLLPVSTHENHRRFRTEYFANPAVREMGAGRILKGLHRGGHEFPVQISLSPLIVEGVGLLAMAVVRRVVQKDEP